MGITGVAVRVMFDMELSLRIISYFVEEHSGGISELKAKKSSGGVRENSRATSKASAALV